MKHIWGKSFFRCWHLCNVHAPALFCYFLRVHVQRFSERGGRVALCAGSTLSWCCPRCCLANRPSGIWWPMDWCWLRKSQGVICENLMFFWLGGRVFFLWLLLLMLSICFYDCYFGTTAWLNLCSNLFLIFLYFAFEVDITSWLNLVQIVILLLLYFVFFFFSLSPTALLS